jgi:hypothetical protein
MSGVNSTPMPQTERPLVIGDLFSDVNSPFWPARDGGLV